MTPLQIISNFLKNCLEIMLKNSYLCASKFFTGQNNLLIMISYMNMQRTDNVVRNWMRTWDTYECMGVWEQMQNHRHHTVPGGRFDSQVSVSCASLVEDWNVAEK